jgi:hypothetical protein
MGQFGGTFLSVRVFAFDMQYYKERVDDILNSLGFKDVYTKADDDESKVLLLGSVNLRRTEKGSLVPWQP